METGPQTSPELSLSKVWGNAWSLYRLLFRRSILAATAIYVAVDSLHLIYRYADVYGAKASFVIPVRIAAIVVGVAAPVLLQGALIELVRDVHEGRRPQDIWSILTRARRRALSLILAWFVYTLGVILGLVALIVPGLLAFSRWSLMAPAIMLEGRRAGDARSRSRELVRPYTWAVCGTLVLVWIVEGVLSNVPWRVADHWTDQPLVYYGLIVAASALTAPFEAHVLSVLYYRITDPEQPVLHPDVRTWRSVWQGA
jgi:hypothetical protein